VNRRHARRRGLVFHRLLQHAVRAAPVAYKDLVKVGAAKPVRPLPPGVRGLPDPLGPRSTAGPGGSASLPRPTRPPT